MQILVRLLLHRDRLESKTALSHSEETGESCPLAAAQFWGFSQDGVLVSGASLQRLASSQ